jgi:hypothetical protein
VRWIGRAGPLLVLPALFFFAYAFAWRLSVRSRALPAGAGELSTAASFGEPEDVGGFLGSLALGGGVLRARLVPLSSAPEAQRFDAAAIARRLGAELGEPWRLELAWDAPASAGELELGDVRVEGAEGARLAPLPPPEAGSAGAPLDPLRTFLARSPASLAPGAAVETVLLGAPPAAGAHVFVARRDARDEIAVPLVPARVRTAELERSIARAPRVAPEASRQ